MSIKNSVKYLIFGSLILALYPTDTNAYSYNLSAISVYKQARAGNYEYFRLLQKYPRAIDIMDNSGNTAYCLALRSRDRQTMSFLASHGANTRHSCVNRIMQNTNTPIATSNTQNGQHRFAERGFFDDDKNIYYTAAGIAVAGGAIALLISASHSGGSSSGGSNPPSPTPTPDPEPVGDLTDMTPAEFKTTEYTTSNFLAGINAADAYSHIFQKDTVGNIFGHQADSTERLKKVKVGIFDVGTYANNDISGKIVKTYNINAYSGQKSLWVYLSSPKVTHYVVLKNGQYYAATFTLKKDSQGKSYYSVAPWSNTPLTLSEVRSTATQLGLSFDSFTLANDQGGSNPGVDLSGFDPFNDFQTWVIPDSIHHGTHVAGIIAASKDSNGMHGVAFNNAQLYTASWDLNQNIYNTVKDMIDDGVKVINHSWGASNSLYTASVFKSEFNSGMITVNNDVVKSYIYGAKRGSVWVQSAGNDHIQDADYYAGMRQVDLSAGGYNGPKSDEAPYISVVSLDPASADSTAPAGKLASYSNWCGSAKDYCIATPGTDVVSTGAAQSGTVTMDGTSMAAPVVTGSIALLTGYYPWLSAQNIGYLLLETANRTGEYADSDRYGRGALDLNAAVTTPIGSLSTATSSDMNSLQPVNQNKLNLNGTTQKALANALPKKITAFDELHRPFDYDTSNWVSETHASNANFRNKVSHAALSGAKKTIKDEKTGFSFSQSEALDKGGRQNLSSAEVLHEATDGSITRLYYAENSKYMVSENVLTPSTNPFLAMNEAYGAENTMKLSDVSKFKLSLQTGENGMYERDYEQDRTSFTERSYAINAEYSFNLTDYLELSTLGGLLYEEDAMLGMNGQGGFAIKDGSTYYMGLKAALNLTTNFTLLAAYYRGYTQGQEASMLALSDIETESYMLAGEYKLSPLHKIGLSLSSPLSVVRGKASFKYASGRDNYSDTVYMKKLTSSLKPAAKEYDLGLYYQGAPQTNLNLLGKVETRFNADGEKGLTDYLGIVGMQYSFPK